jgi:crotonobetainyl-CoA:carnitine CoA-transferase CaiB-like acyl-CoA transferase
MKDLEGLLVVSVEQAVAAPYASSRLADAGARVIKIERPEGDFARGYDRAVNGESAYFVWLNRGKQSCVLDLKEGADRALLARLVAQADVFIQNLAPGAIGKLGFGVEELRKLHPGLVACSISGYGEDGPLKDLKAYDLLVQAESGLAGLTGNEHGPGRTGVSVCDIAAGMTAYQAILEALIARGRNGEGRAIDVSLYSAVADWMNVPYLQYAYGGAAPARAGLKHPTIAPYGAFACADGKALLISIQNDREWRDLCAVIGEPGLADDPRFATNLARVAHRAETDAVVARHFASQPRDAHLAVLQKARIAYGRLSDLDDVVAHPQNRFVEVATPRGPARILAPGAAVRGAEPGLGPVPALGEHTAAIRTEFAA